MPSYATLDSHLPEIIAELPAKSEAVVGLASDNMVKIASFRSRVLYGFMKKDWKWEFVGVAEAEVFDLIEVNNLTKGRQYAVFNEYGTEHMAAQPMLWPALYETKPLFEEDLATIFDWT